MKARPRHSLAGWGRRSSPALEAWRQELADGTRTPNSFDPLWRAACAEMTALEADAAALPTLGATYRQYAQSIIAGALREML